MIGAPVVLPLYPRTARRIDEFGLTHRLAPLRITEPLGYSDFLAVTHSAALLISDSGGVVEEASVVKTPVIIVRRSTERPEIENTFGLRITPSRDLGTLVRRCLHDSERHHHKLADLPNGSSSQLPFRISPRLTAASSTGLPGSHLGNKENYSGAGDHDE